MKRIALIAGICAVAAAPTLYLTGCITSGSLPAGTTSGQLFCALATANGGQLVTSVQQVVDGAASALGPIGTVAAFIVTGLAATTVQNACTQAAAATGAVAGVPVSPPAAGVATATVTVPASKLAGG